MICLVSARQHTVGAQQLQPALRGLFPGPRGQLRERLLVEQVRHLRTRHIGLRSVSRGVERCRQYVSAVDVSEGVEPVGEDVDGCVRQGRAGVRGAAP